jgi:hypothetical protein
MTQSLTRAKFRFNGLSKLTNYTTEVVFKTLCLSAGQEIPRFYGTRRFVTIFSNKSAIRSYPEPIESSLQLRTIFI